MRKRQPALPGERTHPDPSGRFARNLAAEWPNPVLPGLDDAEEQSLRIGQVQNLIFHVLEILQHQWFGEFDGIAIDHHMTRLLLTIYYNSLDTGSGTPKSRAWEATGVRDVKTARKYVARAIELGWIKGDPSPSDKRVELLVPTESLARSMEKELAQYLDQFRSDVWAILQGPLPDTGAPLLFSADSPELIGLDLVTSVGRGPIGKDSGPAIKRRLIAGTKLARRKKAAGRSQRPRIPV